MLQLRITHYFGRIGINHVPSQLESAAQWQI